MNINKENYEQFFLDHAEGNLSREMEKELSDFLEANPDLKPVLEEFDAFSIEKEEIRNDKLKTKLKKHLILTDHITGDNIDDWMIRDIEGLLDKAEVNELKEFLMLNQAYSFDYKIFGFTKLSPDLSVTYRNKKELKKKVTRFPARRLAWIIPAAAAIVLIFIGIRYLNKPELKVHHPVTAPVATLPALTSPAINTVKKTSSLTEKKTGTPSQERIIPGRIRPIAAREIISLNPTAAASLNLASFNHSPAPAVAKRDRSLISKVFGNMMAQAREGIADRAKLDKVSKSDLNFWSIAKAGINGFNSMSDRDLELYVRKDESGKVKSYALVEEERLILSKELNKN
jgi:hypothetical protein